MVVKLRRKNDNFYEDYLHRGSAEYSSADTERTTPLCDMSFYEYGMFVRVMPGDPWSLRARQYAFAEHHSKFETHVQELRPGPAVPFIHGFTMPTRAKDEETNACFKQLLLRPHRCRGPAHCLKFDATTDFCTRRLVRRQRVDAHGIPEEDERCQPRYELVRTHSYVRPWRAFEAQQLSLAEAADMKIHAARKYPVLSDITLLRSWWLPGAVESGIVHRRLAPFLAKVFPMKQVWHILRFAGHVTDDDGAVVGIANNATELEKVREQVGCTSELAFTSVGVHDEQLTPAEFSAWRRIQCAAWLDQMAEARGRQRPGAAHPEALADDPDGVQGGEQPDEANVEHEEALPGGDKDASDVEEGHGQIDPTLAYQPRHQVADDQVFALTYLL